MAIHNSLKILNDSEITELFDVPKIDPQDRELFFELTIEDEEYLATQPELRNKLDYILQTGYFRATRNFYKFKFVNVIEDAQYIINRYYPKQSIPKKLVDKNKYYAAQHFIMKIYNYRRCDSEFQIELARQANRLSQRDLTPRFIFDELLHHCEQHQIIRPKYSTLQSIVSRAILREENRLAVKLGNLLNKESKDTLDSLVSNDKTISSLALLKQDAKSFTTTEMEAELVKQKKIVEIYKKSKHVLLDLGLSRQNLNYYAETCEYYSTFMINRFNAKKSRLLMICLIWHRFIKITDHLVDFFIYKINWYETEAEEYANDQILEAKIKVDKNIKKATKILKIVGNEKIDPASIRPNCFNVVSQEKFSTFTNNFAKPILDQQQYLWEFYDDENGSIKRNLRNIALSFDIDFGNQDNLKKAFEYVKGYWQTTDKNKDPIAQDVPIDFISKSKHKYIIYKKSVKLASKKVRKLAHINIKRYEMAIYQALSSAITGGNIFIQDSVNYRSLESEIIKKTIWSKDKYSILKSLSDCINTEDIFSILAELKEELSDQYRDVNQRIKSKENEYIKIDENGDKVTWRLPYKREDDSADNPYYEKFTSTGISEVIDFTANDTNFFDSFKHILNKGSKSKPRTKDLKAYLVSQGEAIGHKKIAESSDVSYQNLIDIEGKFIRVDSLVEAGDIIIDAISKLPIFKYYNLSDYGIHASLDGQKIETKYQTILSRYSTKYFGYGKGVVSYSLIANHLPVSTKIIGANEHESHYVLDIIYNNNSDLNITTVSGDMHSVNRVNFALLKLFGYSFMPRMPSINLKAEHSLGAFKGTKSFKNDLIKPSHIIDEELIISEWDEIQRIVASIAKKDTSQSAIIKKLSSYSRKNRTLKALIEFDKIVMSIYVLKYIDDIQLRRNVHRALNRGEAFHQLRKALFQVNGKKILGKSENSLEISNQCNRVLACCIIYYNACLLSELLEHAESENNKELGDQIKKLSPVAWQHISLLGNFVFSEVAESIDIKGIVKNVLDKISKN